MNMQSHILINLKLTKTIKCLTLGIQAGELHLVRTTEYDSCYFFVMERVGSNLLNWSWCYADKTSNTGMGWQILC